MVLVVAAVVAGLLSVRQARAACNVYGVLFKSITINTDDPTTICLSGTVHGSVDTSPDGAGVALTVSTNTIHVSPVPESGSRLHILQIKD